VKICACKLYKLVSVYTASSRYSDWPRAGSPRGRSSSPGRVKNFLHVVQTGSGVHPTSYPMGTGVSFPGIKRPGREVDHLAPVSAEVRNGGSVHPVPHTPSWRSA
jgi:hypothetical protein